MNNSGRIEKRSKALDHAGVARPVGNARWVVDACGAGAANISDCRSRRRRRDLRQIEKVRNEFGIFRWLSGHRRLDGVDVRERLASDQARGQSNARGVQRL